MQTNVHANERPSRFLKQRIGAFSEVLTFFASEPKRQVAFLLQIEFWDWEMDGLIFAIESFTARSVAWHMSGRSANDLLATRGLLLTSHSRKRYSFAIQTVKVVAPTGDLADLVSQWNHLVDRCENLLDHEKSHRTRESGGRALENLARYRKQPLHPNAG